MNKHGEPDESDQLLVAEYDFYNEPVLRVDDRVKFAEEGHRYTVQAVSEDGRWVAATKPFNLRHTTIYTLIDTVNGLRGVDDSVGRSLGYETREQCEEAIKLVASGEFEFSRRCPPIPLNIERIIRVIA